MTARASCAGGRVSALAGGGFALLPERFAPWGFGFPRRAPSCSLDKQCLAGHPVGQT